MSKTGIKASVFGLSVNFILFIVKLYVGISSNSLSVYCDSINNLGDTFSCIIALSGFFLIRKYSERKSIMTQNLSSFVIGSIVTASGAYFAYAGTERLLYPTPVSYSVRYAVLIVITIFVKLIMGIVFYKINKKSSSAVIKTLALDSFMDCVVTFTAFLGFNFTQRVNLPLDGFISVIIGIIVAVSAGKTVYSSAKYIINA